MLYSKKSIFIHLFISVTKNECEHQPHLSLLPNIWISYYFFSTKWAISVFPLNTTIRENPHPLLSPYPPLLILPFFPQTERKLPEPWESATRLTSRINKILCLLKTKKKSFFYIELSSEKKEVESTCHRSQRVRVGGVSSPPVLRLSERAGDFSSTNFQCTCQSRGRGFVGARSGKSFDDRASSVRHALGTWR